MILLNTFRLVRPLLSNGENMTAAHSLSAGLRDRQAKIT